MIWNNLNKQCQKTPPIWYSKGNKKKRIAVKQLEKVLSSSYDTISLRSDKTYLLYRVKLRTPFLPNFCSSSLQTTIIPFSKKLKQNSG